MRGGRVTSTVRTMNGLAISDGLLIDMRDGSSNIQFIMNEQLISYCLIISLEDGGLEY